MCSRHAINEQYILNKNAYIIPQRIHAFNWTLALILKVFTSCVNNKVTHIKQV